MTLHFKKSTSIKRAITQAGFTLLELLISLTIVAFALIVIVPNFSNSSERQKLELTANKIAATLRETRAASIRKNETFVFILDLKQRTYKNIYTGSITDLSKETDVKATVALSEVDDESNPSIRFWPDGSSTGGEIILTEDNNSYKISVDWLTGSVSLDRQTPR